MTKQAEVKKLNNGDSVCSFSVAIDASYTDKAGQKVDRAYFPRFSAFGKTADYIATIERGSDVSVRGEYTVRKYQGADGSEREAHEFKVHEFRTIRRKRDAEQSQDRQDTSAGSSDPEDDLPF